MHKILRVAQQITHTHILILLGALCTALLIVSPHIRAWNLIGSENFRGVYPIFSDDEITYQARIKEVVEGNLALGNPYIKEHKNDPFIMPPLAEWAIASIVTLTGTSVPFITSASDFVLGFINFILVYVLFSILTGTKKIALFYTILFFIAFLSTFGRPISPQVNTLFLFLGLITITKIYVIKGETSWKLKYSAGLIAGITCFISPYYFTALLAFAGILFTAQSIFEKSYKPFTKNIPWFLAGFLPLASLYAFFHIRASTLPFYDETMSRYGVMHTHIPGSFTNMVIGGIVLTLLIFCHRFLSARLYTYGVAGIVTVFVLNWQNIITGTSLQFSSHYLMVTVLFVFLALAIIHTEYVAKVTNLKIFYRTAVVLGCVCIVSLVMHNQKREFLNIFNMPYSQAMLLQEQSKMDVFDWLNIHTSPDSVVYALGGGYDFLLPVYTKNNVYFNFYAALYPASHKETEERWLAQHTFDPVMSTAILNDAQREFWGNRYIDIYQSSENRKKILLFLTHTPYVAGDMVPDTQIEYMYTRWHEIQTQPKINILSRYDLEYILLSPDYIYYDEVKNQLDELPFLKNVVAFNAGIIYAFITDER